MFLIKIFIGFNFSENISKKMPARKMLIINNQFESSFRFIEIILDLKKSKIKILHKYKGLCFTKCKSQETILFVFLIIDYFFL
jgi:hypothetical protein